MTKLTRRKAPLTLALSLAAAVVLAGCGTTESPAAAPTTASPGSGETPHGHPATGPAHSSTPSGSSSASASRRIEISVKGKQVTPAPRTVNLAVGESMVVAVTSDKDNVLHAHGFEVEKTIKAGQTVEVEIKGGPTGLFEFELHDPELRLFTVAVR